MLRVLGSPKRMCDGVTRRDMLWAGGLGLVGLGLADFYRLQAASVPDPDVRRRQLTASFGKAKSCILLFLYGSPSQLETVDMKPNAPVEIRGELKPIRSSLPGLEVCELMPHSARIMDKVTVVRSLTHPYPIHGVAYATTGVPAIDVAMELNPHDLRHWPFIGSVVGYLAEQTDANRLRRPVPDNIALPFPFSSRRTGEVQRAGPYAAFLGGAYNPHWTEFDGEGTVTFTKTLAGQTLEVKEPYMGIRPDATFRLAHSTQLPAEITIDRLQTRKSLLAQFDEVRRRNDPHFGSAIDKHRERAYSLIGSQQIRQALDIAQESPKLRDSYGMTVFGQACLAARRLVEAGSKFVTVFWDEYGLAGSGWDTHWNHYPRMKQELMPGFDRAFAGLISDLDQRGLLDETLVCVLSEHGRTPRINNARGGGRDHWSQAYSAIFAGGGVARGRIVGKTDKHASSVLEKPISPKDILATIYHLLGIDPETTLYDRSARPLPLVPNAEVVTEMLA